MLSLWVPEIRFELSVWSNEGDRFHHISHLILFLEHVNDACGLTEVELGKRVFMTSAR